MGIEKQERPFIPGLIINITDDCNCKYCPPYGENLGKGNGDYDENAILYLIDVAKKHNVQQVRFTGGEPLLKPERLKKILVSCEKAFKRLVLNTNGFFLHNHFNWLVDHREQIVLKISFDILKEERFNQLIQYPHFQVVHENLISAIDENFNIELNVVLYDQTIEELVELIEFAVSKKIDLKFLTVSSYYGHVDSSKYCTDINSLLDFLIRQSSTVLIERLVGGRGVPMLVYHIDSTKVTLFDSRVKQSVTPLKNYFSKCEVECSQYPCDYGAFSMGVSTDGLLSVCRQKKNWGHNIFLQNPIEIEKLFLLCLKQFESCFEIDVNSLLIGGSQNVQ